MDCMDNKESLKEILLLSKFSTKEGDAEIEEIEGGKQNVQNQMYCCDFCNHFFFVCCT